MNEKIKELYDQFKEFYDLVSDNIPLEGSYLDEVADQIKESFEELIIED